MEAITHLRRIRGVLGPLGECAVKDEFGQLVVQFEAYNLTQQQHGQIKLMAEDFSKGFADVTADIHSKRVYYFPFPKDESGKEYNLKELTDLIRKSGIPCKPNR